MLLQLLAAQLTVDSTKANNTVANINGYDFNEINFNFLENISDYQILDDISLGCYTSL